MFLRATTRKKDGKAHRYFSVVENRRVSGGRVLQRHVLYLGEINSSQELAWRRSIEVLDEGTRAARLLAPFPEDRCEGIVADASIVRLKLAQLRLERLRRRVELDGVLLDAGRAEVVAVAADGDDERVVGKRSLGRGLPAFLVLERRHVDLAASAVEAHHLPHAIAEVMP